MPILTIPLWPNINSDYYDYLIAEVILRWQLNNRQRNNSQFNAVLLAPCGATAKHGKYYFGNP